MRKNDILTFSVLFTNLKWNWYSTSKSAPFYVGTSLMHLTPMHNDTDEGNDAVQENGDDDDSGEGDYVLQKNSMQVVAHDLEDDIDQVLAQRPITLNFNDD